MSDSTPPLRLSNETNVRMPLYLLLGLLVVCSGGAIAWANVSGQVSEIPVMRQRLDAHDVAIQQMGVMANDLTWIKRYLEHEQRQADRSRKPGEP